MKLLLALALVAVSACGGHREAAVIGNEALATNGTPVKQIGPRGGVDIPADCPLRVEFGSYAMGIDGGAAQAVRELLASDPGVASVQTQGWGREGESTTCVFTRSDADAERLFHAISRLFPAEPRGPLSVSTRTGLRHSAGRR